MRDLVSPNDLVDQSLVPLSELDSIAQVARHYTIRITPYLVDLMNSVPDFEVIAKQYVPSTLEAQETVGELSDPIGDTSHSPVPGIIHRYRDRVLLMPVRICAVYCRFCFRREAVGPEFGVLRKSDLDIALSYISETSSPRRSGGLTAAAVLVE